MNLSLEDGKYTIILENHPYSFVALRYGEQWRDLTGDKLILALVQKVLELEDKLAKMET